MAWLPPSGGSGARALVEMMVGDQVFADLTALINWSNANLNQLRNNNDPITSTNPWNKSIAQVGTSPNQIVYQWDGDNLPSSFPTENAWTPRDRTLNASEIKMLYESNANTNAFDDAEKGTVDSVQAAEVGVLLSATATGVRASGLKRMTDNRVMTETGFGVLGDGGIDIGPSVKQVDIGTQSGTRSAASQKRFASALVEYNRQTGWLDPTFSFNETAATGPEPFDFQTVFTETITNPSFQLANTATRILDDLIFRAPDGVTNSNVVARLRSTAPGNPVIKYIPNEADWLAVSAGEYVDENGNQRGFTFTGQAGVDNTIDIHDSPVQTLAPSYASLTYIIDFVGNGDVQFLGDTNGVPYLRALGHAYEIKPLSSRVNDLIGEASQYKVSTISQSSLLSYDPDNSLGPGVFARITNSNAIVEPSLATESSQVGTAWIVFNDTSSNVILRTQSVGGRNGRFRNSTQDSGREQTLTPGQTALIVAEDANQAGDTFFGYTVIGRELQLTEGSNVTITGTYPNLTISSTGGGGGGGPTVQFERVSTTLPQTTVDNAIVIVEPSGTDSGALINITLPNATATYTNRRITIVNNRSNANGRVDVLLQSGDSIANLFGNIELAAGESVEMYCPEENTWVVNADGEIPRFPSLPANPNNDDNTFMFSVNGDSSSTWNRDRNTSINLNRASGSSQSYEVANPSTSGITINDGDGYIFRNVNTISWNVFPFSSANTMVVTLLNGTTQTVTSSAPLVLPANNSLVLLYDSGQSRWEGQLFNSLIPIPSAGAGGSSEANSSSLPDSGKRFARNEDIIALVEGDGVHIKGVDGYQAMVKAGLGLEKRLNGFVTTDTAINDSNQVIYFGKVRTEAVWTGVNKIGDPLSVNDPLYWDEAQARVRTDDESGVHYLCGRVLSSNWILPVGTTFGSNQVIDTQTEWDDWQSLVHTKGFASTGDVQIPDLAEGSSEVTAVAGQRFVVRVPNGEGTLTIRPRGASTIAPAPGTAGSTYTNASPLPMTGGASDEIVVIEVNESANGYYHYPINTTGIVTEFHFSALEYARAALEGADYQQSVIIQQNTAAINVFKRNLVIPNVVDAITNPSGLGISNIDHGLEYETSGGSVNLDRGWTISTSTSDWPNLQANMSVTISFYNSKLTTTAFIDASSGNFFNGTGRVLMNGATNKRIRVKNTGSAIELRDVT